MLFFIYSLMLCVYSLIWCSFDCCAWFTCGCGLLVLFGFAVR